MNRKKIIVKAFLILARLFLLSAQAALAEPVDAVSSATALEPCEADFDCNGAVDGLDLLVFA